VYREIKQASNRECYCITALKMFNDLPCEVRGERDLKCFRRMLVQHIKRREHLEGAFGG